MKRDRLLVNKDLIPYNFNILLADELFNITIGYNEGHDFFTVALMKDDEMVCEGEPVVYGVPLFRDIYIVDKYPAIDIIPIDESGTQDTVTFENLGKNVFFTVDNAGGDGFV